MPSAKPISDNLDIKHIIIDFDGVLYVEADPSSWPRKSLNQELVNWIRENKSKYTFSILSNSGSFLNALLKDKLGIYDDFEYVFNSSDIGLFKPDPAVFKFVIGELDATPSDCLFIDDNYSNIESAGRLGMNAVFFTTNSELFEVLKSL